MNRIKIHLLLFVLTFLTFFTAKSQDTTKFNQAMRKGIRLIDTSTTITPFIDGSNYFERIAISEKSQWLAWYWSGYCNLVLGIYEKDNDKKDGFYDKTLTFLDSADKYKPDESEIYALKGYVYNVKIPISPMSRGPVYGPKSTEYLTKAQKLNPDNPRPYYIKGQGLMYTPAMFGGGKNKALPFLDTAVQKYQSFKKTSSLYPDWGKKRAENLLDKCRKPDE